MAFVDLVDAIFFYPVGMELAQVLTRAFTQFARTRVAMIAEIHSALRVVEKDVTRNIHRIEVEADAARFSLQIENVPSAENPRTGRLTALSVIAALKKLTSPLAIGT